MPTNVSMIKALERTEELIRELNAYGAVLKDHIRAQKHQHGRDWNDRYVYDEKRNKVKRVYYRRR